MRSVWTGLALAVLAGGALTALATQGRAVATVTGTVAGVAKTRLTVKETTGTTSIFRLTERTVYERKGEAVPPASVKLGERVTVEFERTGRAKTAVRVRLGAATAAYGCPMHPAVVANEPGKCPECGMNLTPRAE